MTVNRRAFLTSGSLLGVGLLAGSASASIRVAHPEKEGVLRFSSQEWLIPGKTLQEKIDKMEAWGFEGIEFGGGGLAGRVEEIQKVLGNSKIKTSAICAGFKGAPVSDQPEVRQQCLDSCKEILAAAGAIGSTGLIIVPAFNGQTKLGHVEARNILVKEILPELGEAAQTAGTRILLEPLNRGEAWILRQLADAAAICRDVNHPAICMMGDFYHMGIEEPCDYAAFMSCRKYVHHVHLASRPNRKQPGYDPNDDFRPGFKALKEIGFQDYCSFECGVEGKADEAIPKTMEYLRRQWDEA
jgi:sugar phosphate isomerase/epimerase